jgi:Activator of Hsp90 ATPase homolog 1-like protein
MASIDFSVTLVTHQTPHQVFQAIRNVPNWWSGYFSEHFAGNFENLHDEFTFHAGDGAHYSKQKLIEVISDKKIVWLITESELSFLENKEEWTGTKVIFEISKKGDQTEMTFTHEGLNPEKECYDSCSPAWTQYLQNKLLPLITTGQSQELI